MSKKDTFHSPFAEVGKALKKKLEADEAAAAAAKKPPPPKPKAKVEEDDGRTFAEMMGSAPIRQDPRGKNASKVEAPPSRGASDEAEAWVDFASLVEGQGGFDFEGSDEIVEGAIAGLDKRILRSLRRGDYPIGARLDLHGMTREVAREAVESFVAEGRRRQHRAVLIIHGKGLSSESNIPVLKQAMKSWLERGKVGKHILAFSTARPQDGGAGAVVLLLRR